MERIALAREYRVADWLRDACSELVLKKTSEFDDLRPKEPYSNLLGGNWEANAKRWEARSRYWETIARISQVQTEAVSLQMSLRGISYRCERCEMVWGEDSPVCKCQLLELVDEAFGEELKNLREYPEYVEHGFPSKLPLSYPVPVENNFV